METDQGNPLRLAALPAERLERLFSIMDMLDHYPRGSQKPGRHALPGDCHAARPGV